MHVISVRSPENNCRNCTSEIYHAHIHSKDDNDTESDTGKHAVVSIYILYTIFNAYPLQIIRFLQNSEKNILDNKHAFLFPTYATYLSQIYH